MLEVKLENELQVTEHKEPIKNESVFSEDKLKGKTKRVKKQLTEEEIKERHEKRKEYYKNYYQEHKQKMHKQNNEAWKKRRQFLIALGNDPRVLEYYNNVILPSNRGSGLEPNGVLQSV